VASTTSWGGLLLQNKAQERVIADLTEESAQAGANTLLIRSKRKAFKGSYATGDAYRCPKIDETLIPVQEQPIE
jgi:3-methyladenine DNA glycosylase Tag